MNNPNDFQLPKQEILKEVQAEKVTIRDIKQVINRDIKQVINIYCQSPDYQKLIKDLENQLEQFKQDDFSPCKNLTKNPILEILEILVDSLQKIVKSQGIREFIINNHKYEIPQELEIFSPPFLTLTSQQKYQDIKDKDMNNSSKINIGIAGHTNTGKTTFIRTLIRTNNFGEVDDRANVTRKSEIAYYDGLQANFIDTPGIQHAGEILMFYELKQKYQQLQESDYDSKWGYDKEVIQAIKTCNIVLYIGSLETVPDDTHKQEICLLKSIKSKIIGILNQQGKAIKASNKGAVDKRIEQWTTMFKDQNIEYIFVFDSHWDKPKKIDQIYEAIYNSLNNTEQNIFKQGLLKFRNRQEEILEKVCNSLASCIIKIRNISIVFEKNHNEEGHKEIFNKEISQAIFEFTFFTQQIYQLAAENPTGSVESIVQNIPKIEKVNNAFLSLAMIGGGFSIGSIIGGAIGGAIGVGIGFALGGVGTPLLLNLGVQIGTIAGGIGGGIKGFEIDHYNLNNVDIKVLRITKQELSEIFVMNLSLICGLSNLGVGSGRKLNTNDTENIKEYIEYILNVNKNYDIFPDSGSISSILDCESASIDELISCSKNIISSLEKE